MKRAAGIALLVLMAIHASVRPEGAWVLLAACDLAAIAIAVGLLAGWHRLIATAFVFQLAVGLPLLVVGFFSTYKPNVTGIAIHVVPLVLGGIEVRRRGLPRYSALAAWLGAAGSNLLASAFAPDGLNLNFAARVWTPLAGTLTLRTFQVALWALVGVLLLLAELALRRRLSSPPARARSRPRGTA